MNLVQIENSLASRPAMAAVDPATKGTYAFISLGCPKNTVDSERMMGLLRLDGYRLVAEPDGADFVVVNTCGFIERARDESLSAIDQMLELKRAGRTRGVIVAGCLAERQKDELLQQRPEIDSLVGVFARDEVTRVADRLVGDLHEQRTVFRPAPVRALADDNRFQITPRHFAYLKISEGCDRLCTFCAIPKMRGKHASKPMDAIVNEAAQLVAQGVRELIIVAQDTTYYGIDLYGRPMLRELLARLQQLQSLRWIRLMYWYPMYIDQDLLQLIADSEKIVPYVDMPLQHINDHMLRRMSRRVDRASTERLLDQMRSTIEDLVIRSTFITGFPGETDQQFAELCEFVRDQQFERMGVFTYSFEPDTPAARLAEHLSETVKQQRQEQLMAIQQEISLRWNRRQIGRQIDVLIDRPLEEQPGVWIGRSWADAPDVDGLVFVTETGEPLATGQFARCEIVAAKAYDLIAAAL